MMSKVFLFVISFLISFKDTYQYACSYKNVTYILSPSGFYTTTYYMYDPCFLSTCCGSLLPGTPNVCCDAIGVIVGIATGCVFLVVIVIGECCSYKRQKKKRCVVKVNPERNGDRAHYGEENSGDINDYGELFVGFADTTKSL